MLNNLIGEDIKLFRARYDEALALRGIPVTYQFPNLAEPNTQGESVVDSYSEPIDCFIFFDGAPKVKTFRRYGWTVENSEELPFLVHCSFNLPHVQRDSIFRIGGRYSELSSRIFRVTEITYDLEAPDHLVCQVVPVYDTRLVGRTKSEVAAEFNTSNHFLSPRVDYRGHEHVTQSDVK